MSNTATHIPRTGIWVLIALLLSLNIIRILLVPATYDEVAFFRLFHHSYTDIVTFKVVVSANVHPLNFVVTKFFTQVFSNHIFFLRLGSLLAQLLYLAYSYKLVEGLFKSPWWQLAALILLNCNPFLFDFWTINRGYGMAIAFMTMSCYHLLRFAVGPHQLKQLTIGLLASALACYSNFALLHYHIGILVAMAIYLLPSAKVLPKKLLLLAPLIAIATTSLLYVVVSGPIQALKDGKQLYHGGSTGFYTDTIKTLVKECLLEKDINASIITICSLLIVSITVANGLYILVQLFQKKTTIATPLRTNIFLWLALICTAASVIGQFYANNTLLLTDRTALFFYVLFVLTSCSWLYTISQVAATPLPMSVSIWAITLLFLGHFATRLSIRSTWQWAFDRNNITVLERMKKSYHGQKIHLGPSWLFEPTMNYYILTAYSQYIDTVVGITYPIEPKDSIRDFYYIPADEQKEIPAGYLVDTTFTVQNTNAYNGKFVLLKKNKQQ